MSLTIQQRIRYFNMRHKYKITFAIQRGNDFAWFKICKMNGRHTIKGRWIIICGLMVGLYKNAKGAQEMSTDRVWLMKTELIISELEKQADYDESEQDKPISENICWIAAERLKEMLND